MRLSHLLCYGSEPELGEHHAHLPSLPAPPSASWPLSRGCKKRLLPPEGVEPVLFGGEHVPHVEAAGVSFVPLLQVLVFGVVTQRHDGGSYWEYWCGSSAVVDWSPADVGKYRPEDGGRSWEGLSQWLSLTRPRPQ